MVELVLEPEEGSRLLLALGARRAELREHIDIPAGAERFGAGAFEDDDVGDLGLGPFLRRFRERERKERGQPPGELGESWGGESANLEPRNDFLRHGLVEGVEFFGPVELDGAQTEVGVEENIVGRVRLWDHGYR